MNRSRSRSRWLVLIAILSLASSTLPGCSSQQTPAQKLYVMNRTVTVALTAAADARDAGLVTQAELDKAKPAVLAYRAASLKAGEKIQAAATQPAQADAAKDAVDIAAAAMQPLLPLIEKTK